MFSISKCFEMRYRLIFLIFARKKYEHFERKTVYLRVIRTRETTWDGREKLRVRCVGNSVDSSEKKKKTENSEGKATTLSLGETLVSQQRGKKRVQQHFG